MNSLISWIFLLPFLHDFFLWISKQIPEVMDGPMQHETSDRCRAILKERETVYYHASQWSFYIDLMDSVCGADHRRL